MSASFDPYYTWLAIPPDEQPPDHYRLIGVRKFEQNADVISNAADQRMTHLRTFQGGKQAAASQKLLNEVASASAVLLHPKKKRAYDQQLQTAEQETLTAAQAKLPRAIESDSSVAVLPVETATFDLAPTEPAFALAKPRKKPRHVAGRKSNPLILWIGAGGILLTVALSLIVVVVLISREGGGSIPVVKNPPRGTRPPAVNPPAPTTNTDTKPKVTPEKPPKPSTTDTGKDPIVVVTPKPESDIPPIEITLPERMEVGIDLLAKIDWTAFGEKRPEGVKSEPGKLVTNRDAPFVLPVKVELPERYVLEASIARQEGTKAIGIGLVVGGKPVLLVIDQGEMPSSGLDVVDGLHPEDAKYVGAFRERVFLPGAAVCLRIEVEKDKVTALLGDEPFYAWQGDPQKLSLVEKLDKRETPGLFLATWESAFEITEWKLLPARDNPVVVKVNPPNENPKPGNDPPPVVAMRRAAPDAAQQKQVRDELRKLFKKEFEAAKTTADKVDLARKLQKVSDETKTDWDSKFMLLEEGRRLALDAANLTLANELIEQQARDFAVDEWLLKVDALRSLTGLAKTPADRKQVAELSLAVARQALAADSLEAAEQAGRIASASAARGSDTSLRGETNEFSQLIDDAKRDWKQVQAALETLKSEPTNVKANLLAGKYFCFIKGDWERGLPLLAKGDNVAFAAAATADLLTPTDPEKQAALGDVWWDTAGAMMGADKSRGLARADHWYRLAQPLLTGITKTRVDKRLDQASGSLPAARRNRVIPLLKLIDPAVDQLAGTWQMSGDKLLGQSSGGALPRNLAKIYLPYQPPEEYDLKVSFMQEDVRNDLALVLPKKSVSFAWIMGGRFGVSRLSLDTQTQMARGQRRNPTENFVRGTVMPGQVHTSLVQVRNEGVRGFIDGKLRLEYRTDYRELGSDFLRRIPDPSRLALEVEDPTTFYSVDVTEVTGSGKVLREMK